MATMLSATHPLAAQTLLGNLPTGDTLSILFAFIAILVGFFVSRYVAKVIRLALGNTSVGETSLFINIARIGIALIVAFFICENFFGIELSGIVQALGITTLVVSLGLQDLIRNVVAGLQILVAHLFKAGDQLEVGSVRGEVMDVSWRQTVLRDKDGNSIVVPNAELMSSNFIRREGEMVRRYIFECDIKPGLDLVRVAADIEQLADDVLDANGWRSEEGTQVVFLGSTANGVKASVRIFLSDIAFTTRGTDVVMRAIGQRGYLADWTNDTPHQEQWR